MVRKFVHPRRLPALRSSCRPRGTLRDGFHDRAVTGVPDYFVVARPACLPALVEVLAATTKVARKDNTCASTTIFRDVGHPFQELQRNWDKKRTGTSAPVLGISLYRAPFRSWPLSCGRSAR